MSVLSNPKHERFCRELERGKSAAEAYRLAGFKDHRHNAATLAHKQHIIVRVAEILSDHAKQDAEATAQATERLSLTKEWVLANLKENVERALQATEVKDSQGRPIGEYRYEGSVANRALELLGKELGMFIDRSKQEVSGSVQISKIERVIVYPENTNSSGL